MSTVNSDALQQMLQQLRNNFLEDIPEELDRLGLLLVKMERNEANNESFNEFYRIIHSLKGSGSTFGLHIIATICHQLENLLNTTGGGTKFTPELTTASLNYVDLLRAATVQLQTDNKNFFQIEMQLDKLNKQLAQKLFTVLLVDDSRLNTNIYLEILAEFPLKTAVMHDGPNALTRALTEPFDLLITSNEIPILSGIAIIGALKLSSSRNRNIKTILVTSNQNMSVKNSRVTDTDFIVFKDEKLAQNLVEATQRALSITK